MVDIVICVHNSPKVVEGCLKSVYNQTKIDFNLIIIDDGSDSNTQSLLENFTRSKENSFVIRNEKALKYTKAANQGINRTISEYVILLNSDTIVSDSWAQKMIAPFNLYEDTGLTGPLSNAASFQSVPLIYDEFGKYAINKLPSNYSVNDVQKVLEKQSAFFPEIDFLNGFCMAIKRNVFNEIGYLDESLFPNGYGEEIDFCLRARKNGYKLRVADNCYIYHVKSQSYGHHQRDKYASESREILRKKYGNTLETFYQNNRENALLKDKRQMLSKLYD